MDEKQEVRNEKNPVGAAILSALFPGVGFFYIGNVVKAIAFILIFASLIVLQVEARGKENIVFGLMIAGFYIFQIFDSYDEARRTGSRAIEGSPVKGQVSLFWAVIVLVIGVFFQLAELDVITYRHIARMWPIFLIGLGGRYIYSYYVQNKEEGGENE